MSFDQLSKYIYSDVLIFHPKCDEQTLFNEISHLIKMPSIDFSVEIFRALLHKSFVNESKYIVTNNEKLEFLGDSVLQLYMTEKLYKELPDMNEGELSKLRASIVNEQVLYQVGKELGLDKYVVLGKGELKEKGHLKPSIISDCFEALLGALYLRDGYEKCAKVIEQIFEKYQKQNKINLFSKDALLDFDAKSTLQEIVMKKFKQTPEYRSVATQRDGNDVFEISLFIGEQKVLSNTFESKKKGMQLIAKEVLKNNLLDHLEEKLC